MLNLVLNGASIKKIRAFAKRIQFMSALRQYIRMFQVLYVFLLIFTGTILSTSI